MLVQLRVDLKYSVVHGLLGFFPALLLSLLLSSCLLLQLLGDELLQGLLAQHQLIDVEVDVVVDTVVGLLDNMAVLLVCDLFLQDGHQLPLAVGPVRPFDQGLGHGKQDTDIAHVGAAGVNVPLLHADIVKIGLLGILDLIDQLLVSAVDQPLDFSQLALDFLRGVLCLILELYFEINPSVGVIYHHAPLAVDEASAGQLWSASGPSSLPVLVYPAGVGLGCEFVLYSLAVLPQVIVALRLPDEGHDLLLVPDDDLLDDLHELVVGCDSFGLLQVLVRPIARGSDKPDNESSRHAVSIAPKRINNKITIILMISTPQQPPSTVVRSSKPQTPIRSPEPDQSRTNILTPTKVKYLGSGAGIKGFEIGQVYQSCSATPQRIGDKQSASNRTEERPFNGGSNGEYVRILEQQVQVLAIENRNLYNRLVQEQQRPQEQSYESAGPSSQTRKHLLIEKIKEQYEEKLSTLKFMVEQEIKQAMDIVDSMCEVIRTKMRGMEERVDGLEGRVGEMKISKIMSMDQVFNQTRRLAGYSEQPRVHLAENSISDILCVSIPEEEEEESKNYTLAMHRMEEEIEQLRETINQTEAIYRQEQQQMRLRLQDKDAQIIGLTQQLYNLEQQRVKHRSVAAESKFNSEIRQELRMLQSNVNEMAEELAANRDDYERVVLMLEQKNSEVETVTHQLLVCRDKLLNTEKYRIMLEQKVKYLEGTNQILQSQLRTLRQQLESALATRQHNEKEHLLRLTSTLSSRVSSKNVMTLTSRIDRLLELEERREEQQRREEQRQEQGEGQEQRDGQEAVWEQVAV